MSNICVCSSSSSSLALQHPLIPKRHTTIIITSFAAKVALNSILNTRGRRGAIQCPGCKWQGPGEERTKRAPPGVDTRIHWDNEDEGWIGGGNSGKQQQTKKVLGESFGDLLTTSGSHYEFLGVSAEADLEEIKAAYRRLSKEYHPDTTSLPLKTASDKFMKLREVYNVLSNEESRRFYDWTLAQEAASRQAEKMKMRLEDPYEQQVNNWESVPDMVDRLGGKNMELGDQAVSAITIDVFIIIFAICCIIYVLFFKEPYYY